jgi:hypothetical protein
MDDLFALDLECGRPDSIRVRTSNGSVCRYLGPDSRAQISPATGALEAVTSENIGRNSSQVLANPGFTDTVLGSVTTGKA